MSGLPPKGNRLIELRPGPEKTIDQAGGVFDTYEHSTGIGDHHPVMVLPGP